jgi:hypothetical protein
MRGVRPSSGAQVPRPPQVGIFLAPVCPPPHTRVVPGSVPIGALRSLEWGPCEDAGLFQSTPGEGLASPPAASPLHLQGCFSWTGSSDPKDVLDQKGAWVKTARDVEGMEENRLGSLGAVGVTAKWETSDLIWNLLLPAP